MRQGTVIVDVDDVVLNLVPSWVARLRELAPTCPDPFESEWEQWDLAHRLPQEFHDSLWACLDHDLYETLPLVPRADWGIEQLRIRGHRVVFATSCTPEHAGAKWHALARHGLLPNGRFNKDYVEIADKSLLRGNVIVDDRPSTCQQFVGHSILFKRTFAIDHLPNRHPTQEVAANWEEVIRRVDYIFL